MWPRPHLTTPSLQLCLVLNISKTQLAKLGEMYAVAATHLTGVLLNLSSVFRNSEIYSYLCQYHVVYAMNSISTL